MKREAVRLRKDEEDLLRDEASIDNNGNLNFSEDYFVNSFGKRFFEKKATVEKEKNCHFIELS